MFGQCPLLDECRAREEDGMVQEQADLAFLAVGGVDHLQKVEQLEEGHVGVDIFDVGLQEGVLQRTVGYAQGALALEIGDLILANSVGQWFDPGRQVRTWFVEQVAAEELHGVPGDLAGVAEARPLRCFVSAYDDGEGLVDRKLSCGPWMDVCALGIDM
jgi:hypothetical protein